MAVKGEDLGQFIEHVECLNQDPGHPVANIFQPNGELVLKSETDPQLLIKVTFRQPVKLTAISFSGKSEDETAPRTVKLFLGKDHIGFSEAETEEPTQQFELEAAQVDEPQPVPLRFVKFQNVTSIQIFVEDNFGADLTTVQRIQFLGMEGNKMDMKDFKPIKG
eukprot:TRINITY_DN71299_c0_g1_i1.p1 TRINITY_DN71299_c0_g1~~TRINITY_DN71299_c0_g1_i1.p1  ORF type:complete len:164 (+),score=54.57 TRINITY_DN71299_c0_g1_i1:81-572(+)